jgi:hypothetical protein
MPDERRKVIITKDDSGRSSETISIGALIITAALVVGIWYFTTQTNDADESTSVTIEIDPGGE